MTEKLTTAEVRLAATTNLDLPLTQYKKLENGFDSWLESIKAAARIEGAKKALAAIDCRNSSAVQVPKKENQPSSKATSTQEEVAAPADDVVVELPHVKIPKAPKRRRTRNRPQKRTESEIASDISPTKS